MPPKGRRSRTRSNQGLWVVALVAGAIALAATLALVLRDDAPGDADSGLTPVTGFVDVHGLALDPRDPSQVYVATHAGLILGRDGGWSRVGSMQDDLMGFTMHPTERAFWVSGHPRGGGNMGVRQSTDGGHTWRDVWTEPVDFHAMTVSPVDADVLWGAYAGKLYRSDDAGVSWRVVSTSPPPMRALVASPGQLETLYATTQSGIARSTDGGASWHAHAGIPAYGLAIDPTDARRMVAAGQDSLWTSEDAGATWTPLAPPAPGSYAFVSVARFDPRILVVATYETAVHRSEDAGATWRELKGPRA